MLQLIINLLTPIFVSMGAAATDVENYVNQCANYIYGLLAALVALIVVLVAAHWAKKGTRGTIRWTGVLAFLLAALILVNSVCYGPMKSTLETFLSGGGDLNLSEETVANSREIVKKIGEEGIVLAKNDGLLPLASDVKNLNVFGWASIDPIYGGTGSGGSSTESNISILQSLADAGYKTNEDLTNMYKAWNKTARGVIGMSGQDWTLPEPTV